MKTCKVKASRWLLSEIGIDEYLTGEIVKLLKQKEFYVIIESPKGEEFSMPITYVDIL